MINYEAFQKSLDAEQVAQAKQAYLDMGRQVDALRAEVEDLRRIVSALNDAQPPSRKVK